MAFKIQITPRKSEQLVGAKASFARCEKCHSIEFVETGFFSKAIICAQCSHRFNKGEGAIYKRIELEGGKSSRKIRPGSGARFKKSELDFGRRK